MLLAVTTSAQSFHGRDNDNRSDNDERHPYAIGLWGDLPYSDVQALTGVPNLIADMNEHDLAFTMHDGDLKAGNGTPGSVTPTTCTDALLHASSWLLQLAESSSRLDDRRQRLDRL
jgi:hypothetical protein